jgi:hypothetical protein
MCFLSCASVAGYGWGIGVRLGWREGALLLKCKKNMLTPNVAFI